ncbi:hypothetical protein [Nonomuraea sp. KM90]|uniref:hypothetical protein n=1 Tax=Nonomuraea sp. KM90 TaxID=3457428 RepID=UPI003FCD9962
MVHITRKFAAAIVASTEFGLTGTVPPPAGVVSYQVIETGGSTIVTVTQFETEEFCRQAQLRAEAIRMTLTEFGLEDTDTLSGAIMVSQVPDGASSRSR